MSKELKLYPLTSPQQSVYYGAKYSYKKSIANICSMISFEVAINHNLMLQAIYLAMLRNQSSSLRLKKVDKAIMQYFSNDGPEQIAFMDYSDKTEEALEQDLNTWSQAPFPNKFVDTQLYKIKLIKKPDGYYGIYFCVNHIAFDAYSLMTLAGDIINVYLALRDGQTIPVAKGNLLKCFQEEWDYDKSPKHQKDTDFWASKVYATEPLFTSINGANSKEHVKGKRYGTIIRLTQIAGAHENYQIPAELASKVFALADSLRVSSQCIYLLCLRSFLSKVNDFCDDVTIPNTVARRASLVHKYSGGTRVQSVNFRMHFPNSLTLREACEEVSLLQRQYYSHADITTEELMGIAKKKYGVPPMKGYNTLYFTYQPYFIDKQEELPFHINTYCNGATAMCVYLTIMALDHSGALNCNYDYMKRFVNPGVPKAIHEHLLKCLEAACSNPDITLEELNRL